MKSTSMRVGLTTICTSAILLSPIAFPGYASAQQTALINGAPQPYVLTDAKYDEGFKDRAIRVTGSTGFAVIPFTATLINPALFTFEALVKMESPEAGSANIIGLRREKAANAWQLWCNPSGALLFQVYGSTGVAGGNVGTVRSVKKLGLGQWHHVCVSFDADNTASIYIDGVLDAKQTLGGPVNSSPSSAIELRVAGAGKPSQAFRGMVGDVRFYEGGVTNQRLAEVIALMKH